MKRLHCDGCGKDYWESCAWQHKECVTIVTNVREDVRKPARKAGRKPKDKDNPVCKWDRESWNAYMKEYMAKYRARKRT